MWSVVEVHICVICACLPSLRPVLTRFLALTGLSRSSTSSSSGGGGGKTPSSYHSRPNPRREASLSILGAAFFGSAHEASASGSRQNSLRNLHGDVEMGNTAAAATGRIDRKPAPQLGQIEVETRLEVHSTLNDDTTTLVDSRTGSRGSSRESEELRLVPEAHRGWYRALVERDRR